MAATLADVALTFFPAAPPPPWAAAATTTTTSSLEAAADCDLACMTAGSIVERPDSFS